MWKYYTLKLPLLSLIIHMLIIYFCFIPVQNQWSMSSLLKHIVQTQGVTGLYRGLTVNLLKVTPAVGISYIVYEHVKKLLRVNL